MERGLKFPNPVISSIKLNKKRKNLKSGNISRESVYAQHHFPWPLPLSSKRAATYFAVVLPYSPPWIHSIPTNLQIRNWKPPNFRSRSVIENRIESSGDKPDVSVAFESRTERSEEVAGEEARFLFFFYFSIFISCWDLRFFGGLLPSLSFPHGSMFSVGVTWSKSIPFVLIAEIRPLGF